MNCRRPWLAGVFLFLLFFPWTGSAEAQFLASSSNPASGGVAVATWTPDPEITALLASEPQLLQAKLDIAMRKVVANPKILNIQLIPINASETAMGHFAKVLIQTENGTVDTLVLHKADLEFNDVQLDTTKLINEEKVETRAVGLINMDVVILENDLNAFLQVKAKNIKVDEPKVTLVPGKIVVSGSTRYSLMKVKFWATGDFGVQDSKSIWFYTKKLKINGLGMPRAFVGSLVKRINPVLNLEKFPFRLNLKDIKIEQGAMRFTSTRTGQ